MQLRSPEVSYLGARVRDSNNLIDSPRWANHQDLNHTEESHIQYFPNECSSPLGAVTFLEPVKES